MNEYKTTSSSDLTLNWFAIYLGKSEELKLKNKFWLTNSVIVSCIQSLNSAFASITISNTGKRTI